MSTLWFSRRPGENVAVSDEDPTMLLVGRGAPDWLRLPPELGGARVKVLDAKTGPCPKCNGPERLHLRCQDGFGVAECPKCEFVWYRSSK